MVLLVVSIADILFPLDTVYCSFPFLELFFLFHCSNFFLANLYRTFIAAIPPLVSFHCFLRAFFFFYCLWKFFYGVLNCYFIVRIIFSYSWISSIFREFFFPCPRQFSRYWNFSLFFILGIPFLDVAEIPPPPPLPCLIIGIHSFVSIMAFLLLEFLSFFDDCFYIWNFSFIRFLWGYSVVRKTASTNVENFPSSNLIIADCIPRILLSKGSPLFGSLFLSFTVNIEW